MLLNLVFGLILKVLEVIWIVPDGGVSMELVMS